MNDEDNLIERITENRQPHYEPFGWHHWPEHPWLSYQFRRGLGETQEGGGAVSEVFQAASRMVPGDKESWHREWLRIAERNSSGDIEARRGSSMASASSSAGLLRLCAPRNDEGGGHCHCERSEAIQVECGLLRRYAPRNDGYEMILLLIALITGAGSAFAFQPAGLWLLMPVAFAVLLELINRAKGIWGALLIGWLFGLGQFAVGLNWIATAFTYQAAMPAWLGWLVWDGCCCVELLPSPKLQLHAVGLFVD